MYNYNTFMLGQDDFEESSWTNQKYKIVEEVRKGFVI